MGAISGMGNAEEVVQHRGLDVLRIDLRTREQLEDAKFQQFLREHFVAFQEHLAAAKK
jgi:hypothetical protein